MSTKTVRHFLSQGQGPGEASYSVVQARILPIKREGRRAENTIGIDDETAFLREVSHQRIYQRPQSLVLFQHFLLVQLIPLVENCSTSIYRIKVGCPTTYFLR
jgi:hypothetical protein